MVNRSREGGPDALTPAGATPTRREPPADVGPPTSSDLHELISMMAERIDRLERQSSRLEGEFLRLERRDRCRGRRLITVVLAAVVLSAAVIPLAARLVIGHELPPTAAATP